MKALEKVFSEQDQVALAAERKKTANVKKKARKQRALERADYPYRGEQLLALFAFSRLPSSEDILTEFASYLWYNQLSGVYLVSTPVVLWDDLMLTSLLSSSPRNLGCLPFLPSSPPPACSLQHDDPPHLRCIDFHNLDEDNSEPLLRSSLPRQDQSRRASATADNRLSFFIVTGA